MTMGDLFREREREEILIIVSLVCVRKKLAVRLSVQIGAPYTIR